MSDLLSAAAAAMGVPEAIAERSARARAAATGQSYEEILAAWAGGEAPAAAPTPASRPEPVAPSTEAPPPDTDASPEEPPLPAPEPSAPAPEPVAGGEVAA